MVKRNVAVADCETDPFKIGRVPAPFIWGFYDGTIYKEFTETKDFIDYVKDQEIIIYAHNGGKFDWHFVKEFIPPEQKLMVINGRLASFKIGACEFRDSYNLLPVPLAAYQKTTVDYSIFEKEFRNLPKNKKIISDYLKDDCVFLFELIETFINDYGLNLTLAGSAMKFWRKNFYTGKSFSSTNFFFEQYKQYYYGGRVECFEKGLINKEFKVHDINSAYPFAMQHRHAWGTAVEVLEEIPKHPEQCFIKLACISNGAFPFREKTGLNFPKDNEKRVYSITGWEYVAAKELNLISNVEILKVEQFQDQIEFTEYTDHFFKMKAAYKDKDKARYLISKLFLNSLYGKFAANPQKYKDYWTIDASQIENFHENTDFIFTTLLNNNTAIVEQPLPEEEQRYYNVATAASVTGFVRAYMLRHMTKCGNLLYCDTDSIAHYGKDSAFEVNDELGAWDCEGTFENGAIAGKKLYAFKYKGKDDYKTASKGVRLNSRQIYAIAKGEEITYQNEAPTFSLKKGANFIERKIKIT
jgi:hypothetical protein